ncbi:MAG: hypothetical protein WBB39_03525 [Candidatus Saccharimonadales bacterium]
MESKEHGYWQPDQPAPAETEQNSPASVVEQPQTTSSPELIDPVDAPDAPLLPGVSWEASEFVHRQKDMIWFVGVGAVGLVLALIALLLLHSVTFMILIVVMVAALIFLAVRPPRIMSYQLFDQGLQINDRHYSFREFRAFGVVQEDAMYYITLLPVKRFAPAIDLYFPQEHGEQIVDTIGAHVPMQTMKPDIIDHLTRYLRF